MIARPLAIACSAMLLFSCKQSPKPEETAPADPRIYQMDPAKAASLAKSIESTVTPQLYKGLNLKLWAVDSLVSDPVAIDIDNQGRIYYTRTIRQKNSEFDIRSHQDWEIGSIQLKDVEEKRAFLHKVLAPELSAKNTWMKDLNGDGSHDWRDMTVQKERVYRVEDTNGDGIADKSQIVVEDFNDETTDAMGGVMKDGDDLFVALGPDLWRIKENAQGTMASKTSISHGYGIHVGFSGHGMSGVEMGPEGKIYWQIGDIGFNGTDQTGKKWEHPNSGVICRSNPDGSDFEVFAYGNRNTHEFTFDEYGNLVSEDNDGDHPGESERIVYVVNGADIGWRTNWQFGKYRDPDNNTYKVWMDEKMYVPRWEGQAAYILPTIRNFVNGPTGFLYNPGTALGPEWKNHFFVAEFVGTPAGSGIHGFRLKPKGASFDFVDSKKMLGNVLATGMDWGPDGSMYLADWIDGWGTKDYGRIWKLDVDHPDSVSRKDTEKEIRADYKTYKDAELKQRLYHADMRVRQKAQFELFARGQSGLDIFKAVLADRSNQLARVHAVWGISQFARKNIEYGTLLVPYLKDADPEIRAQAAKWLGDVRFKSAGNELIAMLKDEYPRARFFAAEALGRTAYAPAIPAIIDMLAANNDVDNYLRHAGSLALARIGKAEPIIALTTHPSRAVRVAAVIALRRMQDPGVKYFLKDGDEFIVTEAARAINDDLSIPAALPDLADALKDHRFHNEPLVRRAISANLRVATAATMQNLIDYANYEAAPVVLRNEAINALSTWAKPSVLDRVDGRFRGEITRPLEPVQQVASVPLLKLLANKDAQIRVPAAKALGKLHIDASATALLDALKKDGNAEVRIAAVKSLAQLKSADMDAAITLALGDKEKTVRVTGLDLLNGSSLSNDRKVALLENVISTRTPEERQAAITALGRIPLAGTEKVFTRLVDQMEKGALQQEVWLELGDALDSNGAKTLRQRYDAVSAKAGPDSLKALYAGALAGGDPGKGAEIFWGDGAAQCVRCHAVADYGGHVGPNLKGIADRLKKEQLLEALIEPSARIAPGFGLVTLELKNGDKVNGTVEVEKADSYVMKVGDKSGVVVKKADVAKRNDSPSAMPQMNLLLTKKEIRDVVAYLSQQHGKL